MNNYYNPYYPTARNDCHSQAEMRNQTEMHNQAEMRKQSNSVMTAFPEDYALAMAYVPFQMSNETYDAEKALCQGTLFPVLDKPFVGC